MHPFLNNNNDDDNNEENKGKKEGTKTLDVFLTSALSTLFLPILIFLLILVLDVGAAKERNVLYL